MKSFAGLLLLVLTAAAQVTAPVRRSITASGQADVAVAPDQARVTISVVTQSATADDAVIQNAGKTQAVIDAVNALIGTQVQSERLLTTCQQIVTRPARSQVIQSRTRYSLR